MPEVDQQAGRADFWNISDLPQELAPGDPAVAESTLLSGPVRSLGGHRPLPSERSTLSLLQSVLDLAPVG